MIRLLACLSFCVIFPAHAAEWFEELKAPTQKIALYKALHAMPKGGDLHNHNSGSVFAETIYDIALAQRERGYRYYTKVKIENCRDFATNDFPYYLLFRNILASEFDSLDACEQSEYLPLDALDAKQRDAWQKAIILDEPDEGRREFFETHWQRLNSLLANPYLRAEFLAANAKALAAEGAIYLEVQVALAGAAEADGTPLSGDQMAEVFRERLNQPDMRAAGIVVRLQGVALRFAPGAEDDVREVYKTAVGNRDLIVGMNMAGREDDDKGHPRRFLETFRELRQKHALRLAIHAGEVDEPNAHVRDTLLIGAERIGHGLNLITDENLMRQMRFGPYLVEINLVSNLLLEYVVAYSQHPFPEYLRTGIPVALSTDDRGMWDSTLTDEFFVAVTEFNLTWEEVKTLSRNSLQYAFVEEPVKQRLLDEYDRKIRDFERRMARGGIAKLQEMPDTRSFICARYSICN